MNSGALIYLPPDQAPPLSSRAIKMLQASSCQPLPLQARVSSATVDKSSVWYHCAVSSVTTNNSWTLSYRYSEFATFSRTIEDDCTCRNAKCSGSCPAIREFLWACFPTKRLSILSRLSRTIADRQRKFETVLQYLLRCVLLPGSAMKCLHLRRHLPRRLFEFLGVLQDADKRSLLQVFVDNYQNSAKRNDAELLDSFHSDASTVDSIKSAQCTICLEEMDVENDNADCHRDDFSVVLPCGHAFHRACIFEWLLFHFRCPVCRARVGPSAVVSSSREKNHTFQWWLGAFKEDPLSYTSQ